MAASMRMLRTRGSSVGPAKRVSSSASRISPCTSLPPSQSEPAAAPSNASKFLTTLQAHGTRDLPEVWFNARIPSASVLSITPGIEPGKPPDNHKAKLGKSERAYP